MLNNVEQYFGFQLDDFQLEAIRALEEGRSVVVCAPTGSGKTVIAEWAVEMALASNKRCFYTTPLKALSNQKFYDFGKRLGADRVGLLTGDTSINRDAPVVVMTTEVFRNMLYGTVLGDVHQNLRDVSFVILDECHYMNDMERGTVWEESIIYSPRDIQLVALSATIANADELNSWIDETHGPTDLIQSNYRPVPLRFYYFGHRQIYPLLSPGRSINTQLKSLFGRKRPNFKGKARPSIAALSPNPGDVLAVLSSRNMLPAIYFLFSRRGCEESMIRARGIPLLTPEEEEELRKEVEAAVKENPNLQNHPHLPYLFEGMSVHHAGMLPSWKGMIERLFQKGLLKVVFATETLAAGINMPARTTVISSISKRGNEGHRNLTASEFLQMSGRAGRRGMDEVGHVVVLNHPFESVDEAAKLAVAPPDPLSSRFTPSYGMVLNLLQRHTIEEAQDLLERSFGQYLLNEQLEPLYVQQLSWEKELERLQQPLCPKEPGDLPLYTKRLEIVRTKHKQMKLIEKGAGHGKHKATTMDSGVTADDMRKEIRIALDEAYAMPCHGCPVQKPCSKQNDRIRHLENRLKELSRRVAYEVGKHWRTFEALANVLRMQGYLDANKPTELGKACAAIRGSNEVFLTEVALSGILHDLTPAQFAAVVTAVVTEESRDGQRASVSPEVDMALDKVGQLGKKLLRLQKQFEVDIPVEFNPQLSSLTEMWVNGATWDDIRAAATCDEGDVVRSLRRTLDLIKHFMRAPSMPEELLQQCRLAESLLNRDEVREQF